MRVIANFLEERIAGRADACVAPDGAVTRIYQANADFVWRSLQRLGVRGPDLDDVLQEVFVVVHQRLGTFDGTAKMTTWLFGIAMRIASDYRRSARVRREVLTDAEHLHASDKEDAPEAFVDSMGEASDEDSSLELLIPWMKRARKKMPL